MSGDVDVERVVADGQGRDGGSIEAGREESESGDRKEVVKLRDGHDCLQKPAELLRTKE